MVSANGCSATQTVVVPDSKNIKVTLNPTQPKCSDDFGSINTVISTTGITSTVTYSWTGPSSYSSSEKDLSNLGSGLYSLNVPVS